MLLRFFLNHTLHKSSYHDTNWNLFLSKHEKKPTHFSRIVDYSKQYIIQFLVYLNKHNLVLPWLYPKVFLDDTLCPALLLLVEPSRQFLLPLAYVRFISYSKCSNWRWISKLLLDFGCLFTFCYLDSIKTDLHIYNLWTHQFASYKSVIYFWFNMPKQDSKK